MGIDDDVIDAPLITGAELNVFTPAIVCDEIKSTGATYPVNVLMLVMVFCFPFKSVVKFDTADCGIPEKFVPVSVGAVEEITTLLCNAELAIELFGRVKVPATVRLRIEISTLLVIAFCLFVKSVDKFVTADCGMLVKLVPVRVGAVEEITTLLCNAVLAIELIGRVTVPPTLRLRIETSTLLVILGCLFANCVVKLLDTSTY